MPSRNLDRLNEWSGLQTEAKLDFYGIGIVEKFWQLEGQWHKRTVLSIVLMWVVTAQFELLKPVSTGPDLSVSRHFNANFKQVREVQI